MDLKKTMIMRSRGRPSKGRKAIAPPTITAKTIKGHLITSGKAML